MQEYLIIETKSTEYFWVEFDDLPGAAWYPLKQCCSSSLDWLVSVFCIVNFPEVRKNQAISLYSILETKTELIKKKR